MEGGEEHAEVSHKQISNVKNIHCNMQVSCFHFERFDVFKVLEVQMGHKKVSVNGMRDGCGVARRQDVGP